MLFDITEPRALTAAEFAALEEQRALAITLIAPPGRSQPPDLAGVLGEPAPRQLGRRRLSGADAAAPLAVEHFFAGLDSDSLRELLPALGERWGVDLCAQPVADKRPRRRLLVFDMDSTLIQCEVIDELAARAGVGAEVAAVTARAMRGELDFRSSFRERMAKLRGLAESELDGVARNLPIMPGAERLFAVLNAQGHHTAILSGGFDYFARRVQEHLGVSEQHANHLQIRDGRLTGEVDGPIVDGERKVALLRRLAEREGFALGDTVAVGDGANDLPMLAAAGLGVAFHAKPLVRANAPCAVTHAGLDALLYLLGITDTP